MVVKGLVAVVTGPFVVSLAWVLLVVAGLLASMLLLSYAAKSLPIGTAYGVWVGIGAAGAAVLGMVVLSEPVTAARVFFVCLLLVAVVGLKATGGH